MRHRHEVYPHEIYALEMHACETHTHEIHTRDMHTAEIYTHRSVTFWGISLILPTPYVASIALSSGHPGKHLIPGLGT